MQGNKISKFTSLKAAGQLFDQKRDRKSASRLNGSYKSSVKRVRRKLIRNGIIFCNIAVLGIVAAVVFGTSGAPAPSSSRVVVKQDEAQTNPLDTISSVDVAANVSQMARLPESNAIMNNADSVNARLSVVPTDSQVVAKPQIINGGLKSKRDIVKYTSVEGDTISSVAQKFGITSESVKWSNDLGAEAIPAGRELRIPPVNGIVYQVKPNDTVDTLSSKYQASKDQLIAFNDAEITGLVRDEYIVIPDGKVPAPVVRSVPANTNGFAYGGNNAIWGGPNGYDYGYCTWYAAKKRAEVGRPIPSNLGNASTWKVLAQRAGIATGSTPQAGAVIWTPPRDYYGHVGYVEEVYEDGSVRVSEMNVRGWGVRSEKTLTAAQAAGYGYIY